MEVVIWYHYRDVSGNTGIGEKTGEIRRVWAPCGTPYRDRLAVLALALAHVNENDQLPLTGESPREQARLRGFNALSYRVEPSDDKEGVRIL